MLKRSKKSKSGSILLTTVIFIGIMGVVAGFSLTFPRQERESTALFVQKDQAFYAIENLLNISRDYMRRLTCDPTSANILFSPQSLSKLSTSAVLNFNNEFDATQILPADFGSNLSNIEVNFGPVLFDDDDTDHEHFQSEAFISVRLQLGDHLNHAAQLINIERSPLCDFQIYSEGDTSILSTLSSTFTRPVHINGNLLLGPQAAQSFNAPVTVAGHLLHIPNSAMEPAASLPLPVTYHGTSTDIVYSNYNTSSNPSTTGSVSFNGVEYLDGSGDYVTSEKADFDSTAFDRWKDALTTRNRVLRPSGFDPIQFNTIQDVCKTDSIWRAGADEVAEQNRAINETLGLNNVVGNISKFTHFSGNFAYNNNFGEDNNAFSLRALNELREITNNQASIKFKLAQSQTIASAPSHTIIPVLNLSSPTTISLEPYEQEKYRYSVHGSIADNIFLDEEDVALNLYYKLIQLPYFFTTSFCSSSPTGNYYNEEDIVNATVNPNTHLTQTPVRDKLLFQEVNVPTSDNYTSYEIIGGSVTHNITGGTSATVPVALKDVVKLTKKEDINNPYEAPYRALNYNTVTSKWELPANFDTLSAAEKFVELQEHYIYMYDKNRRKWIQLIDIDVSKIQALANELGAQWTGVLNFTNDNSTDALNDHVVDINYLHTNGADDIRINYRAERDTFLTSFPDGLEYTDASIGVGIRLINASELPTDGVTISSQFPIYIQGDYNTVNTKAQAGIYADSITVLSKNWRDWCSAFSYESDLRTKAELIPDSDLTINAHIITGRTHVDYWLDNVGAPSWEGMPDAGILNNFRILENWSSNKINMRGSLISLFKSKMAWEPWARLNKTFSVADSFEASAPPVVFNYNDQLKTPHFIPSYLKIIKGKATKIIGASDYDNLNNIISSRNWDDPISNEWTDYVGDLPNILR